MPSLIDADTLAVAGCRLRLFGIDAVEAYQTCRRYRRTWACGEAAIAALADRAYSLDYVVEEALAERERKGVWAGSFVPPWEWRQGR